MISNLDHTEPMYIQLLALDIDGTLLDKNGRVSPASLKAIREASASGVIVVLATGRDYDGIPWEQLKGVDIPYVITTNGSAIYRTKDRKCLHEECIPVKIMIPVLEYLLSKKVYINIFIDGKNYTPREVFPYVENLDLPDYVIREIMERRTGMDDVIAYIKGGKARIQKVTLNFQSLADGSLLNQEDVWSYLKACPEICVVDGGLHNPEFTRADVNKGNGLKFLAEYLKIQMEHTMAVGDSENDLEILKQAGLGVAMKNAPDKVKKQANVVTRSNEEDGVAYAIEKYVSGKMSGS